MHRRSCARLGSWSCKAGAWLSEMGNLVKDIRTRILWPASAASPLFCVFLLSYYDLTKLGSANGDDQIMRAGPPVLGSKGDRPSLLRHCLIPLGTCSAESFSSSSDSDLNLFKIVVQQGRPPLEEDPKRSVYRTEWSVHRI